MPEGMMGPETCFVIDWIEQYWKVYPAHQKVDPQALRELIKLRGGYQPEQLAVVLNLVNQLDKPVDPDSLQGVVSQLNELDFSGRVDALLAQYNQGEDIDLAYELRRLSDEALRREGVSTPTDYVTDDVFDILAEEQGDHGIKLPGLVLPAYMKGLHAGASVLVAAPPDAGKTSFMAWPAGRRLLLHRSGAAVREPHGSAVPGRMRDRVHLATRDHRRHIPGTTCSRPGPAGRAEASPEHQITYRR
ncbi:DNA helicase [Pseudomonas phage vB_PaeP_FBPa18]|nr:DNA helicase [Pseudomonas phage vB_PaeP_FBPa18]